MIIEFREELAAQGQTSKKYTRPTRGSLQRNVGLHARPCVQALGRRALSNLHMTNPNPDLPPALCSGINRLPLPTIVLLCRLRRPLARRVRGSFPPFAIFEVDSYILAVFLVGGLLLADIKPSFPGDVIRIFKKVVVRGLSPCFEGF